jgi:UDP-GlcNAc:undecaprenyl-phosphate GlcNAc-1-phosphate transferase
VEFWHLDGGGLPKAALACVLTIAAIWMVGPVARRIGLVDRPRGRRLHADAVPLTGGIGIFLGFAALSLTLAIESPLFFTLLFPAGLLLLTGLLDDLFELGPALKFVLQVVIVSGAVAFGDLRIESLGNLLGQGEITLGAWSAPFTVFAVVGLINAVNMIDGMDGLAAFVVMVAAAWAGIVSVITGAVDDSAMLLILAGVVAGFLVLNFRRPWGRQAAVFMGDSGSSVLGFVLAWFAIELCRAPATGLYPISAVWILALPVVDALALIVRRGVHGRNPLRGGRDHVHHVLFHNGVCHGATVGALGLMGVAAGAVGVGGWLLGVSEATLFGLLLVVFVAHVVLCEIGTETLNRQRRAHAARHPASGAHAAAEGHTVFGP